MSSNPATLKCTIDEGIQDLIITCIFNFVYTSEQGFNDLVVLSYIRKEPMELLLLTQQFFTSSPMALCSVYGGLGLVTP